MPVPVITVAQMREWERRTWAARRTPMEVISRVGHIITTHARRLTRPGDAILVLAGSGHNGDDARQVVQNLTDREVTLLNVRDPADALREFSALLPFPQALIIEGLFGIGLRGTLNASWTKLIDAINQSRMPILAIDVPAGLDADTGLPQGAAIRATYTLTLGAPKRGLLAAAAKSFVGRLEAAPDIGLIPCPHAANLLWTLPEDFSRFPPVRPVDGHKGTFGHLAIAAGTRGYHGAAVLAARGALRAQPGLVTVCVPEDIYVPVASQLQSAMVRPWRDQPDLPENATAILFGPGWADPRLAEPGRQWLARLWRHATAPLVVDASALDWIPHGPVSAKQPRFITPHPGEAARMLQSTPAAVQTDRPAAVRQLSKRFGNAWVLLKGHQSAIGRATGPIFINPSGNPHLAQGGAGDLLSGYLAGLLAQPLLQDDPLTALRYAAWIHGAAADALTADHQAWTVEDLASQLGRRPPGLRPPTA